LTKNVVQDRRQFLAGTGRTAAALGFALAQGPGVTSAADRLPKPADGFSPFTPKLFKSFFLGGFECSNHRRADGKRLDLIAATKHDVLAASDYRQLAGLGIRTVRDGLRWHLIEASPGRYDWSSLLPMLRAARTTKTQVIWDLCHYGWPDHIDIWSPEFVRSFAAFARAAARIVREETDGIPFFVPVNEISFWAWAGGQVGMFNPMGRDRGDALKAQLVRASIAAIEAIRIAAPRARVVHVEPIINEVADPARPEQRPIAEAYGRSQYQSWDMISGRLKPELGGDPAFLDILGVNYYSANQRIHGGRILAVGDPLYRPLREMLSETYRRYGRPIFIAETSVEFDGRPAWLRYVGQQALEAVGAGVPLEGICWYPIANHPGWNDDRHTEGGLLDYPGPNGERQVCQPLATELRRQQMAFAKLFGQDRLAVFR
jgi:polysaccharide biosynthesis protein PelF